MAKKQSIEEIVTEQTETDVTVEEETVDTVEEVTVDAATHTVTYGETLPSIAELYRGNESNYSYAQKLKKLNANKHLTSGTVLTLP